MVWPLNFLAFGDDDFAAHCGKLIGCSDVARPAAEFVREFATAVCQPQENLRLDMDHNPVSPNEPEVAFLLDPIDLRHGVHGKRTFEYTHTNPPRSVSRPYLFMARRRWPGLVNLDADCSGLPTSGVTSVQCSRVGYLFPIEQKEAA